MSEPTILTTSGKVRGIERGGVTAFWNIPYAKTPAGAARFAAPEPASKWDGVRDGTRPGATAPAPERGRFGELDMSPIMGPGWIRGEDHLTATVWTPDPAARDLPVMVFVHGGGFVAGSAQASVLDGTALAAEGVVLVTVDYRLGVPGWLHLPGAPDNRGMLDVVSALSWVNANIARFGGDPGNVTLFGQSAGATIVGAVVATAPRGVIRRAISQSGSGTGAFSVDQATLVTRALADALSIPPTVEAFAGISDDKLVAALPSVAGIDLTAHGEPDPLLGLTAFGLVHGTETLPRQPAAIPAHDVGLMLGTTTEEGNLYLVPNGAFDTTKPDDVLATAAKGHRDPEALVRVYRASRPEASEGELRAAILTDGLFGAGTRRFADAHASGGGATHVYEFAWRSDAFDGRLGAAHAMELPHLFGTTAAPGLRGPTAMLGTGEPRAELGKRLREAWVRFAATGDPGWAPYDVTRRTTMRIAGHWLPADDPRGHERGAWH